MKLRGFALALAVLAFAVVPLAAAMPTAVSAQGTLVRNPDGSYILEVEGTGDTIQCMRYTAPQGVRITSVSGPGQTASFGAGFGSQGTNITSGSSKSWTFTTDKPLTPATRGALEVSATCAFGSDVTATLEGPIDVQCKCLSFTARILPKSMALFGRTDQSLNLGFTLFWTLNCSVGLEGCSGELELSPPQPAGALGSKLRLVDEKGKLGPATGKFTCKGACAKLSQGTQTFRLFGKKPLGAKNRANKSYTLTLKRKCQGVAIRPLKFTLVFDKLGQVSKKKSDFNGDGKPG